MEFLFEIGLEEVPARMIASAEAELARRVVALLERERLIASGAEVKSYATPRRLAVLVQGVAAKQEDLAEEMQGPSAKIAFKDGAATPAALSFAKKAGVTVESLKTVQTAKGEYVTATSVKAGRSAAEVIAAELPKEIAAIYWAKNMYWRAGKPERFVRPVRWMVALLGGENGGAVVPVEFAGYVASNVTYGHRVLAGGEPITISSPSEYAETLKNAYVLADVEARRHGIRKALDQVCRSIPGARWREDHELVDKLTHLTEWPSVIAGSFEAEFLTLPEEVLVTVMRDHQSYFAVEFHAAGETRGKLAPHFLAVLNTVASAEGEAVIRHGNERVLRARFNDARFFWEFDQRVPLVERVKLLKSVTFQKDLGSYAEKTARVRAVALRLGEMLLERGAGLNAAALDEAALLAKTDLTTELVKEFTELQGVVGGLYARAQGCSDATADAIYDQYCPAAMDAAVPSTVEGSALALADKADTIAGMFSLGLEPTGSKDPFALRRAANGVVKILAESGLPLLLSEIVRATGSSDPAAARMQAFFAERLEFYLREVREQAYDVVKAVLATGADDVRDAVARAEALTEVRGSEDFLAVSAAFKRMKNILAQAAEKGDLPLDIPHGGTLYPAEADLEQGSIEVGKKLATFARNRDYVAAFEAIATLRPLVDKYFDQVMILDPNPLIRQTRLWMLSVIVTDIRRIADLSEIVVAG